MYKIVSLLNNDLPLEELKGRADGVILGSLFSRYTNLHLYREARRNALAVYISIDQMIFEEDREMLRTYLGVIRAKEVAGVYFADLAVLKEAKALGMEDLLIYDPLTLLTNSLDTAFFLQQGLKSCVLARELTLEEIVNIAENTKHQIDLQLFGPLIMAESRRGYLRAYFDYNGTEADPLRKEGYLLQEINRKEYYRILQNERESLVYTEDYAAPYKEYLQLAPIVQRVIVSGDNISPDLLLRILDDLKELNAENAESKRKELEKDYPQKRFTEAYLYRKTNLRK